MAIILAAVVSATLAVVAWQDWRYRRISNLAVFSLLLCALFRWSHFSGVELERVLEVHGINVLLALLIAIPGAIKGIVGAGDTKILLALALLWPTDQFLQAFSMGVLSLMALCLLIDTLKSQRVSKVHQSNTGAISMPIVYELIQRGLPLGTALGLGYLFTAIT